MIFSLRPIVYDFEDVIKTFVLYNNESYMSAKEMCNGVTKLPISLRLQIYALKLLYFDFMLRRIFCLMWIILK